MHMEQIDHGFVILLPDGKIWADAFFILREGAEDTARNLDVGPHEIRSARRQTGETRDRTASGAVIFGLGRGRTIREIIVDDE